MTPTPVVTLHDDGAFTWARDEFRRLYRHDHAGWRMDVFTEAQLREAADDALERAAKVCDRFAAREMHPAECAAAIRAMKQSDEARTGSDSTSSPEPVTGIRIYAAMKEKRD